MIPACFSRYVWRFLPRSDRAQIIALAAVRIWQTVRSDFVPPILLIDFGQEEQTQATDDQMSFGRKVSFFLHGPGCTDAAMVVFRRDGTVYARQSQSAMYKLACLQSSGRQEKMPVRAMGHARKFTPRQPFDPAALAVKLGPMGWRGQLGAENFPARPPRWRHGFLAGDRELAE